MKSLKLQSFVLVMIVALSTAAFAQKKNIVILATGGTIARTPGMKRERKSPATPARLYHPSNRRSAAPCVAR